MFSLISSVNTGRPQISLWINRWIKSLCLSQSWTQLRMWQYCGCWTVFMRKFFQVSSLSWRLSLFVVQETYGEDPYLSGELVSQYVRGLQGDDPRYVRANAGCKHYAVYAGPEDIPSSRFSFDVRASIPLFCPHLAYFVVFKGWSAHIPLYDKMVLGQ